MKSFGKIVVKFSTNIIIFDTDYEKIKDISQRWSKNRPADELRVQEIASQPNYLKKDYIDGIIYSWYSCGKLFIYDGWTRFSAVKLLYETKYINKNILLSVNFSKNEIEIQNHFTSINKAIPVPIFYIENDDSSIKKRIILEDTCKIFCESYKLFVSTSRKPRKPNFNRDQLFEILSELILDTEINFLNSSTLVNILNETNCEVQKNFISKEKIPEKATKGNFYLFCVSTDIVKNIINSQLKQSVNLIQF